MIIAIENGRKTILPFNYSRRISMIFLVTLSTDV